MPRDNDFTNVKKAFQFIREEKYEEAIQLINRLKKEDLEYHQLGTSKKLYLFDYAIMQGRLDIVNAIVERYAQVTDNPDLEELKPLEIDYVDGTKNTSIYTFNNAPFMNYDYLDRYKHLLNEQKDTFLTQIIEKSKELRIIGVEELLKLTANPELEKALSSYKEDSNQIDNLNQAIEGVISVLSEEDKETNRYSKMLACRNTSNQLDSQCAAFASQNHYDHTPLKNFVSRINDILRHDDNKILKLSRGAGEVLASIGNFMLRYTGVGFLVAGAQGKFEDYKNNVWDVFNEKTASETQLDAIADQVSSIKPR